MIFIAVLACFVAASAAAPNDVVIGYVLDDHDHNQKGEAGAAVTGTYSFTGADGAEHLVTYIADEKGYRVVGDAKIGGPKTISRTTQPPIQPPTRPPTRPPTQAPVIQEPKATKATATRAPATKAPAVVQVVPVQALPLRQAIQFIQVPQQFSSGLINGASADLRGGSGFQQLPVAGYSGLCGLPLKVNGEQEVLGQDGTRYVLKKVENQ